MYNLKYIYRPIPNLNKTKNNHNQNMHAVNIVFIFK